MILVTGATGYTGRFLVRRLVERGERPRCLVRPTSESAYLESLGVELCVGDLERAEQVRGAFAGARTVLHLAHIRYARTVLECVDSDVERVVLVSSLRRFSQVPSPSLDEVLAGEAWALSSPLPWVLLRPSMIYGPGDDRNLSRLAGYLRRRRLFPVFGSGRQLRQPVFVEDVVGALLAAVERPECVRRCYALAGGHSLPYGELVAQVGRAVGAEPLLVRLPVFAVLAALWCLERTGVRPPIEREQVLRLQEDQVFSVEDAQRDLGYAPLSLEEGLARTYGRGGR